VSIVGEDDILLNPDLLKSWNDLVDFDRENRTLIDNCFILRLKDGRWFTLFETQTVPN
jgi:hypothetical protein